MGGGLPFLTLSLVRILVLGRAPQARAQVAQEAGGSRQERGTIVVLSFLGVVHEVARGRRVLRQRQQRRGRSRGHGARARWVSDRRPLRIGILGPPRRQAVRQRRQAIQDAAQEAAAGLEHGEQRPVEPVLARLVLDVLDLLLVRLLREGGAELGLVVERLHRDDRQVVRRRHGRRLRNGHRVVGKSLQARPRRRQRLDRRGAEIELRQLERRRRSCRRRRRGGRDLLPRLGRHERLQQSGRGLFLREDFLEGLPAPAPDRLHCGAAVCCPGPEPVAVDGKDRSVTEAQLVALGHDLGANLRPALASVKRPACPGSHSGNWAHEKMRAAARILPLLHAGAGKLSPGG